MAFRSRLLKDPNEILLALDELGSDLSELSGSSDSDSDFKECFSEDEAVVDEIDEDNNADDKHSDDDVYGDNENGDIQDEPVSSNNILDKSPNQEMQELTCMFFV